MSDNKENAFLDLSGKQYAYWTVLSLDSTRKKKDGTKERRWLCQCKCGKVRPVLERNLVHNVSKSCGCIRKDNYVPEELSGGIFGRLNVLYRAEDYIKPDGRHEPRWHCRCVCGRECDVLQSHLKSGRTKSCGCFRKEVASNNHFDDITGQQFGRLTVMYRSNDKQYSGRNRTLWHCKCTCGNECDVGRDALVAGLTLSCGCYFREKVNEANFEDLTGQKFGHLLVLYRAENYVSPNGIPSTRWHCKCDCGNECEVGAYNIKHGLASSCGCSNESKLEIMTEEILKRHGLKYDTQIKFDDLIGTGGGALSYDFGIYKDDKISTLIECQGLQHYEPVEYFGGIEQFERQQLHDRLKRDFARAQNMELIEIPYSYQTSEEIEQLILSYM